METFVNKDAKALSAAITSTGATSMSLSDVTGLPSSGNVRALIDTELVLVTLNGSTTVTIARAQESTSAATHLNGATVTFVLSAGAITQFRADSIQKGVFGSRPSAGNSGLIYLDTDSHTIGRDNGSTFDNFGISPGLVVGPTIGSFTGVGFAAATSTTKHFDTRPKGPGTYIFYNTANGGGHEVGGYVMPVNASNTVDWTATLCFEINGQLAANVQAGICAYESSSGKLAGYGPQNASTAIYEQLAQYATSGTSSTSSSSFGTSIISNVQPNFNDYKWLQIRYRHANSTTEIRFYASIDGIDWTSSGNQSYSSLGSMSLVDYVGFFFRVYTNFNYDATAQIGVNILHWSYTEP